MRIVKIAALALPLAGLAACGEMDNTPVPLTEKQTALLAKELVAPPSGRWPLTPALLRIDPLWDKIRGDPRFQALCVDPPPVE